MGALRTGAQGVTVKDEVVSWGREGDVELLSVGMVVLGCLGGLSELAEAIPATSPSSIGDAVKAGRRQDQEYHRRPRVLDQKQRDLAALKELVQ
ncbi:hypothetical protein TUN205_07363 [Pyrenophora tritici-repentis]|nr:hypothetical protein TUN205_07363 [Pyrenophora tritici-repentis]